MKHTSRYKNGIIGTLLVHSIVLFLAYTSEVRQNPPETFYVLIDPASMEETPDEILQRLSEELEQEIEKMYSQISQSQIKNLTASGNREITQATQFKQGMSEEDYKREIERNALGQSDFEKYIENRPKFEEEIAAPEQKKEKKTEPQQTNYSGPATVVYYLEGRSSVYLDIPVYTCEGEARVTVNIEVSAAGKVTKANIDNQKSIYASECYRKAAINSAQNALFSYTQKQGSQSGAIVYHFIAQ